MHSLSKCYSSRFKVNINYKRPEYIFLNDRNNLVIGEFGYSLGTNDF